jgi:Uma2 family endonuclease
MSSAQPVQRAWTYADLVALPEDQLRHELIDGEHFVTPSPSTDHQQISKRLFLALDRVVEKEELGEVLYAPFDVKLSLFTVLVPDLVFFTTERYARAVNAKHATAAPDLVVEILSPGTRRRDKGRKRAIYDREGVREYWIVDPEARSITALRRPHAGAGLTDVTTATFAAGDILESPLFPSLRIPLAEVFHRS